MDELEQLITTLSEDVATEQIASEIGGACAELFYCKTRKEHSKVLQSIYGEDAVGLWKPPDSSSRTATSTIRYTVLLR
jgi:hypothetical protein